MYYICIQIFLIVLLLIKFILFLPLFVFFSPKFMLPIGEIKMNILIDILNFTKENVSS